MKKFKTILMSLTVLGTLPACVMNPGLLDKYLVECAINVPYGANIHNDDLIADGVVLLRLRNNRVEPRLLVNVRANLTLQKRNGEPVSLPLSKLPGLMSDAEAVLQLGRDIHPKTLRDLVDLVIRLEHQIQTPRHGEGIKTLEGTALIDLSGGYRYRPGRALQSEQGRVIRQLVWSESRDEGGNTLRRSPLKFERTLPEEVR